MDTTTCIVFIVHQLQCTNSVAVKVVFEFCCRIRLSVKTKYMPESVLALVSILLFDGEPDGCQFRPTTFSICRSRNFIQ